MCSIPSTPIAWNLFIKLNKLCLTSEEETIMLHGLEQLPNLQELELQCPVEAIPTNLFDGIHIPKLHTLTLNSMKSMPNVQKCKNLRTIMLRYVPESPHLKQYEEQLTVAFRNHLTCNSIFAMERPDKSIENVVEVFLYDRLLWIAEFNNVQVSFSVNPNYASDGLKILYC